MKNLCVHSTDIIDSQSGSICQINWLSSEVAQSYRENHYLTHYHYCHLMPTLPYCTWIVCKANKACEIQFTYGPKYYVHCMKNVLVNLGRPNEPKSWQNIWELACFRVVCSTEVPFPEWIEKCKINYLYNGAYFTKYCQWLTKVSMNWSLRISWSSVRQSLARVWLRFKKF